MASRPTGAPKPAQEAERKAKPLRWGVWCEPTPYRLEEIRRSASAMRFIGDDAGSWATGPDGVLCLYETVARRLATHFDDILGEQFRHEARPLPESTADMIKRFGFEKTPEVQRRERARDHHLSTMLDPADRLVPRYPDSVPDAGAGLDARTLRWAAEQVKRLPLQLVDPQRAFLAGIDRAAVLLGAAAERLEAGGSATSTTPVAGFCEHGTDLHRRSCVFCAESARDAALHRAEELQTEVERITRLARVTAAGADTLLEKIDAAKKKLAGALGGRGNEKLSELADAAVVRLSELEAREAPELAWDRGVFRQRELDLTQGDMPHGRWWLVPYVAPEKAGGAG